MRQVHREKSWKRLPLPVEEGRGACPAVAASQRRFSRSLQLAAVLGLLEILEWAPVPAVAADSRLASKPGPSARVVIVQDSEATDTFKPRPERVEAMVSRGITNLLGKSTSAESWRSIVSSQDIVGIKVFSAPGPNSGTRPAVVAAVIRGLLGAGVPPTNIIVWDKESGELKLAGFFELPTRFGVRVAGGAQAGFD